MSALLTGITVNSHQSNLDRCDDSLDKALCSADELILPTVPLRPYMLDFANLLVEPDHPDIQEKYG